MLTMICPGCLTRLVHMIGERLKSISCPSGQQVWECQKEGCRIIFYPSGGL